MVSFRNKSSNVTEIGNTQTVYGETLPSGNYIIIWSMTLDINYSPTFSERNATLIDYSTNGAYLRIYKCELPTDTYVELAVSFNDWNSGKYARSNIQVIKL